MEHNDYAGPSLKLKININGYIGKTRYGFKLKYYKGNENIDQQSLLDQTLQIFSNNAFVTYFLAIVSK